MCTTPTPTAELEVSDAKRGDGGAWCYAVKAHAALAPLVARPNAPERLAFSYVCSDKVWTWPSETDIYVPQFFALDLARI